MSAVTVLMWFCDMCINFYSNFREWCTNWYQYMKVNAFENKLLYYAVYDLSTKRYSLIHNYDNPLSIFYFFILNHVFKISYAGISYLDLQYILHSENIVVVCEYVRRGKEYCEILDLDVFEAPRANITNKVVYAYTETDGSPDQCDDLTHEFEKFKTTLFNVATKINAQNTYNLIMGFRQNDQNGRHITKNDNIKKIRYMLDDDFEEKTLGI